MSTATALSRKKTSTADLVIIGAMIVISALCMFPLLHNLAVSFSSQGPANAGLVTVWPVQPTLSSYLEIIKDEKFFQALWVSIERVFFVTVLAFLLTVHIAFPLSRDAKQFPLRSVFVWLLVFVMMFNGGLIPFYLAMKKLHLTNSFWGLVIPLVINVFNVILVINFFRNIPKELDESASIDGAGPWKVLYAVYLPLSVPVLATITLFNIVNTWNEYFLGLIMVQNQAQIPLQTYIQQIIVQIDPTRIASGDTAYLANISNKTLNAAKIMVTMIPIMLVYPFLQRYFINGIMLGSVKE
ncbi:carbohydrate ABC transporter permease [Paenibacillus roseipurpureus]|uniref:Carbohydrate ABC transporter permease n=1 Tax=Paenibacillus roseopurpureus TaxID=2918901 RepID=A0AA96LRZ0_9BACL|nr:carbohydrate ABC transporter permease [Paenibacillus sp. MBLB1832]WNR46141.1 carbohydrate ABC transporter permease [Paenibacillus sp. MBLB1832]